MLMSEETESEKKLKKTNFYFCWN